jgi:hypothetical protein
MKDTFKQNVAIHSIDKIYAWRLLLLLLQSMGNIRLTYDDIGIPNKASTTAYQIKGIPIFEWRLKRS